MTTTNDVSKGPFRIEKNFFKTRDEIEADIKKTGYIKDREFQTPPQSGELPLHWHPTGQVAYVLSGSQWFRLPDGSTVTAGAGDRLVNPPGALHAEGHTGPDGGLKVLITKNKQEKLKDTLRMFAPESLVAWQAGKPDTEWVPIHREVETDRAAAAKVEQADKERIQAATASKL